jgi:hypothetical protein
MKFKNSLVLCGHWLAYTRGVVRVVYNLALTGRPVTLLTQLNWLVHSPQFGGLLLVRVWEAE